ncbi:MucR family transcriptional regulator [Novosphingobium sp. PhB165]|uniref:MucR family transcriptional regulator n=1 Tax=Novosphingobium sp. PhB165 TaxID=2485105 RepID=UPI00104BFBA2|nr:MucR family transcriptional regulator [Novosphingobium sp. PhB165]TCM12999.1 MucR family transcriptional regulator [Novosphingobium sp. PhB165]
MADESLLSLAADIITAHVRNNSVPSDQLTQLIETVYGSLAGLGKTPEPAVEAPREPAVSIRASVKPDGIVCLECGSKFKMIKRHLTTDHQLTVEEYRRRWNLPASYPTIAPDYAERRRELAKTIGLGRKKGSKVAVKAKAQKVAPVAAELAPEPAAVMAPEPEGLNPTALPAAKANPASAKKTPTKAKAAPRKKLGIAAE